MRFLTTKQGEWPRRILSVFMMALTVTLFLALVTDGYQGDVYRPITGMARVPNGLSVPGAIIAGVLYILLGQASHVLYFLTAVWSVMLLQGRRFDRVPTRLLGMLLLTGAVAGLLQVDMRAALYGGLPGGAFGAFVGEHGFRYLGKAGFNVVAVTLGIVGVLLATEFLVIRMVAFGFYAALFCVRLVVRLIRGPKKSAARRSRVSGGAFAEGRSPAILHTHDLSAALPAAESRDDLCRIRVQSAPKPVEPELELDLDLSEDAKSPATRADRPEAVDSDFEAVFDPTDEAPASEPGPVLPDAQLELVAPESGFSPLSSGVRTPKKAPMPRRKTRPEADLPPDYVYPKRYKKPALDLLDPLETPDLPDLSALLRSTSATLEETLKTFGVEARVTDVTRGPTITRFELEPAPGIKVSRFHALADDIALALKAYRVRVEAPIPGKGRVGIEVPNEHREPVTLRELLESRVFRRSQGRLTLALGKDIAGDVSLADLATMPHLLVAGATGAGKTVFVKTLLASLLFTKTPEELQLMLIDPKMVELSVFNDIPHLITPVVTDPKKASAALNWLIVEMEERYRLFAHLRVRNIEVYNESVENGEIEMVEASEENAGQTVDVIRKLPYIVCVIDELADLMMLARAEVEDAIARLAQLARAVGIHVVIATQRPSVDVLTGVIKANFPARVSFQVSSRVDSRCILDEIGAERLIGKGDMLYLPAGQSKPTRIQSAFVSDAEMNGLIAYLKTQAPPQYRDEIANFGKAKESVEDLANEDDELFHDAVRVVLETGQASISMVQRRLRVGYTRAARLIDMMELKGIVGPHTGSKAREILVELPRTNDEVA